VRVHTATEIFTGTTCGLEPDGALRVETATGEIKRVRAGDVQALRAETLKGIDERGMMNAE
jgi:biotin-(acetyl-CoA carboxylase) ligase